MPGVDANIAVSIAASQTGSAKVGSNSVSVGIQEALRFLPGSATTGEADVMFADARSLAASASEDLDLAGTLTDSLGASVAAAEVVAVFIKADASNTNSVIVGGAASNQWVGALNSTGTVTLQPGDFMFLGSTRGFTVTAGTADLLKIANSAAGSAVKYTIVMIGRTVAR